jgi:uncharacterized phage infection (PIP) family protein YhgE
MKNQITNLEKKNKELTSMKNCENCISSASTIKEQRSRIAQLENQNKQLKEKMEKIKSPVITSDADVMQKKFDNLYLAYKKACEEREELKEKSKENDLIEDLSKELGTFCFYLGFIS